MVRSVKAISGKGKEEVRIKVVNIDINRMFRYSAMKISAKGFLAYSVLNPETNSLSPSTKSKGARFVSASVVVNQIRKRIGLIIRVLKK
jgi:hypothetical protein